MQQDLPELPPTSRPEQDADVGLGDLDGCRRDATRFLKTLVAELVEQVCGASAGAERDLTPYLSRLWSCIEAHWRRLSVDGPIRFETLLARLEQGDLGYARAQDNVLRDVVLSQALELREPRAAAMFDEQYMPIIRAIAYRIGGERAMAEVENFAATLILPRGDRPCRIAQYQGRTTLAHWLRAVVTNECISHSRDRHACNAESLPEQAIIEDAASAIDESPCESLLRPLLVQATASLASEDRLLIKMLVLDNVPQKALAASMRINSGNITRRRQKIAATIWQRVQSMTSQSGQRQRSDECLELVLAGPNLELRRRLGQALAGALEAEATDATEDSQP